MKKREPSNLEMQVLSLLWERGPSTVRDIQEALPDGKTRAYTTVLTVMQVMEKKGLLSHTSQGNTHVYSPKVSSQQTLGPLLRNLVRNLFGGSPATAMQHLLDENDVSREELARLKEMIREREKSSDKAPRKGSAP
jgi:predicted transcriptional regulator